MRFEEVILGGADPGANLGTTFTSSLTEREVVKKGSYLSHFLLALKGDLASTNTVAMEAFLDVLNTLVFKAGQETRLQLRGRDLFALDYFLHGGYASGFEGGAGEDNKILGIKIPIWETWKDDLSYALSATRVAVTNVSGEVLELKGVWHDKAMQPNPIIAVEQPLTSAAATGRTNLNIQIPPLGDLIGLIVFQTTQPSATADTATLQRIHLTFDGERKSLLTAATGKRVAGSGTGITTQWPFDVLNGYSFFDFRDDPVDAIANKLGVEVDVQVTSEAARLIPVILKKKTS